MLIKLRVEKDIFASQEKVPPREESILLFKRREGVPSPKKRIEEDVPPIEKIRHPYWLR